MPNLKDMLDLAKITKKCRNWTIEQTLDMLQEVFKKDITKEDLLSIEKCLIEGELIESRVPMERVLILACEAYACMHVPPVAEYMTCLQLSSQVHVEALFNVAKTMVLKRW